MLRFAGVIHESAAASSITPSRESHASPTVAYALAGVIAILVASAMHIAPQIVSAVVAALCFITAFHCLVGTGATGDYPPPSLFDLMWQNAFAVSITYMSLHLADMVWAGPSMWFCNAPFDWRPELFVLGAYVLNLFAALNRHRGRFTQVQMIWIGISWIAPWYGFFSIPVLLGVGLALQCEAGGLSTHVLTVMLGVPAAVLGSIVGTWLGRLETMEKNAETGRRQP